MPFLMCCCRLSEEEREKHDPIYQESRICSVFFCALLLAVAVAASSLTILIRASSTFERSKNGLCALSLTLSGYLDGTYSPNRTTFFAGVNKTLAYLNLYKDQFSPAILDGQRLLAGQPAPLIASRDSELAGVAGVYAMAGNPVYAIAGGVETSTFRAGLLGTASESGKILGALHASLTSVMAERVTKAQRITDKINSLVLQLPVSPKIEQAYASATPTSYSQSISSLISSLDVVEKARVGGLGSLYAVTGLALFAVIWLGYRLAQILNILPNDKPTFGKSLCCLTILNILMYILLIVFAIGIPGVSQFCQVYK
jgi:hypothetical protein